MEIAIGPGMLSSVRLHDHLPQYAHVAKGGVHFRRQTGCCINQWRRVPTRTVLLFPLAGDISVFSLAASMSPRRSECSGRVRHSALAFSVMSHLVFYACPPYRYPRRLQTRALNRRSHRPCWRCSGHGGARARRAARCCPTAGCSRARTSSTHCPRASSTAPATPPPGRPGSPSGSRFIPPSQLCHGVVGARGGHPRYPGAARAQEAGLRPPRSMPGWPRAPCVRSPVPWSV